MYEQSFSNRQALSLSTMLIIGEVLIMYNGSPAKTDIWLSVLLAATAAVPLALLSARLMNVFPGKNTFDLQIELFGKILGRITALYYTLFCMHIGSLVIKDITNFIQITSLFETPQFITAVFIVVLCIYSIRAGINTIARYAALALPVYLAILLVITLLSITLWQDLGHLTPILYNGLKPVIKSSVDLFSTPFSDVWLLPFVLQPLKEQRKARKIILGCYGISTLFFLMVFVRNILILGDNFTYTLYFPSYIAVSLIDIGEFLQRIEVAVGAVLFMSCFIKTSMFLYVASLGVSKVFNVGDYKKFVAPMGMLMAAMSQFAYPNILANIAFATSIYPYYMLPVTIVLPLITWLAAEWKRKKLVKAGRLPDPPPAGEETPVARQDGGIPQNPDGGPGTQPQPAE
jgi:spore germination protein KB